MTGKAWLVAVGAWALVASSGCVTCHHKAAKVGLEVGPTCEVPLKDRSHVYIVMVNGLTPDMPCGLDGLRDKLAAEGFAKVYCGGLSHSVWFEMEMWQVHKCDPSARFVLVGYDFGCPTTAAMARVAVNRGIPVDAVVLLDPVGKGAMAGAGTRTILVRSGACPDGAPHTERVSVPGANHFTLPTDPQTVAAVVALAKESAAKVVHPDVYDALDPGYEFAAPPRVVPPPTPDLTSEWLFLAPLNGPHNVPLTPAPGGLGAPIAPALIPRGGYAPPTDLPRAQPFPFRVPLPPAPPAQPLPTPKKVPEIP